MAEIEDLLSTLLQGQQEPPQDTPDVAPPGVAKGIGPDPRTALLMSILGQSAQQKPFPLAFPVIAAMLGGKGGAVDSAVAQQQSQADVTNRQAAHLQNRQLIDQLLRARTADIAKNRPIGIPPGGLYNPADKSTIPPLAGQEDGAKTGDQVFVAAAKAAHPGDPGKQAEYIRGLRNNPEGWQNVVFQDALKRHKGDITQAGAELFSMQGAQTNLMSRERVLGSTEGRATGFYQDTEKNTARSRAEGGTEGRPIGESAQKEITGMEGALDQLNNVRKNFDKEFLGPIKGTESAFAVRRRVGSYLRSPLGAKETVFRQALKDIGDQLLRARSGAQINEAEYARLRSMLPQASDEAPVFSAGLDRFEAELKFTLEMRKHMATTPRGQMSGNAPAQAPETQATPQGGGSWIVRESDGKQFILMPGAALPKGYKVR